MSTNSGPKTSLEIFAQIRRQINLLFTAQLKSLELGPKQAIMLKFIHKSPRSSHAQLARATATDPAAVGRATDSLVKQGLILREEHPQDRRQWVLILSKRGKEVMEPVNKIIESISEDFLYALNGRERVQLKSLLKKIHGHLNKKERSS
jgi:DNA-binding MarR family transcriptional regulator